MQQGGHQQTEASEQPNSWQQFQLLLFTVALLFPAFLLITCNSPLDNETIFLGILVQRISGSVDHVLRGTRDLLGRIDTFLFCILHGMAWPTGVNGGEKTTSLLGNLFVFGVFLLDTCTFLVGGCFSLSVASVWWLLYCVCMICGWGSLGFFGLGSLLAPAWWRILPWCIEKVFAKLVAV